MTQDHCVIVMIANALVIVEPFGADALMCVAAGVDLQITLAIQGTMDEDHILGLTVFLCLVLCGGCIFWTSWKRQQSREELSAVI